jgi:ABC-2 type transport system ATP-binding protein
MGVMLQRGGVYPGIRAGECLRLFAAYYDDPTDPDELLARLGLERQASTAWRRLSGGEQQRLSLALALVGKPRVAFLDEPTAGVDVGGRQVVRRVIRDLAAGGTCVLVASHELDEVERIADRVVIVDRGRLLATGTPSELVRQGGGDQVRFGAPAGLDVAALGGHLAAIVTEVAPGEYLLDAPASPATVASLTAWLAQRDLPLADLRAGRQSLEDVFVRLTGKGDGG